MNGRIGPSSGKTSLMADQRGAVAFEMPIVFALMIFSLIFPLADIAIAGFQFISAGQALRDIGQLTQYSSVDVTDSTSISTWKTSLPAQVSSYNVSAQIYCSDGTVAPCASGNFPPSYFVFTTTFSLSPMVLGSFFCSSCTMKYTQRYQ
jgi:hypothetical protein